VRLHGFLPQTVAAKKFAVFNACRRVHSFRWVSPDDIGPTVDIKLNCGSLLNGRPFRQTFSIAIRMIV